MFIISWNLPPPVAATQAPPPPPPSTSWCIPPKKLKKKSEPTRNNNKSIDLSPYPYSILAQLIHGLLLLAIHDDVWLYGLFCLVFCFLQRIVCGSNWVCCSWIVGVEWIWRILIGWNTLSFVWLVCELWGVAIALLWLCVVSVDCLSYGMLRLLM